MRNTTVVAEHRRSSVHSAGLRMFGHTQTVGLLQAVGMISGDLRRCVCRRTRNQMERLATLDFVHKAQNLFITGSSGTGRSYLACALGHEACKRGFRTFYANAPKLLGALKVAKVKGTLETELKKIERCQLLILDDLFIVPLDAKERPILLEIIEDRHERKSIIITSQYPSSNWYDMVGDPTIADAILDRIIHTAHTIELYGESMRKLRSKKNEKF